MATYMWLVNYYSTVCTNSLNVLGKVWARKVHILTGAQYLYSRGTFTVKEVLDYETEKAARYQC